MMTDKPLALHRRQLIVASAALLGLGLVQAQTAGASGPQVEEGLESRLFEIIRLRRGYLKTPGVSAAVRFAEGKEVKVVDGFADPDSSTPVTPSTRFMSGSTGKTFCAATVMRLVEDGALTVDTKVASLFGGEDWYNSLPNAAELTVAHLLLHRGGFPQFLELGDFQSAYLWDSVTGKSTAYSPKRMLGFISGSKPLFAVGEGHHYSDLHYHLLGLVIEKLTGTDYYTALADLVLSRLSAHRGDILAANTTRLDGLAAGYARGDLLSRLSGINGRSTDASGTLRKDPSLEYTGGGLALTPRALAGFFADLSEGRIVRAETFEAMLAATKRQPQSNGAAYGFGFYVTEREGLGKYISHSGFYPGYTSNAGYFLDHGFAVAVQQNSDHGPDLFAVLRQIAEAVIS